jgi:hypothetical protein
LTPPPHAVPFLLLEVLLVLVVLLLLLLWRQDLGVGCPLL